MKKIFITIIMLFVSLTLVGCGTYYDKLNDEILLMEKEEDGYIIFTNTKKIDDTSIVNLKDVIKDIFNDNDIKYDFINFHYYMINDFLHFSINYKIDKKDRLSRAALVVDVINLEEILFVTVFNGDKKVEINHQSNNNVTIYDTNDNMLTVYEYENNSYFKVDPVYVRDWSSEESYELPLEINKENTTYYVSYEAEFKIESDDGNIYYEENLFDMFKQSTTGKKIYNRSVDMNKNLSLDQYNFFYFNGEIFITYHFMAGLLMNKGLLGVTKEIVFRFDIETKNLIYIGSVDYYVVGIYAK